MCGGTERRGGRLDSKYSCTTVQYPHLSQAGRPTVVFQPRALTGRSVGEAFAGDVDCVMVAFDTLVTAINTVSSISNRGGGTGVCRIQSPQAGKKDCNGI